MLRIYNTLSRKKEIFKPIHGNRVYMFVCGPTVYDYSHIGHAKTYLTFDIISRYLKYKGYSVFYLQNITDIDDKIINRAKERNVSPRELATEFSKIYFEDMDKLNIKTVNLYAKATEYMDEIIEQIQTLIEKGYAYVVDGNVYFEVKKFEDFGKLSGCKLDDLLAGARVEVDKNKKNPEDFVLWKKHKEKEGEPSWESPWSLGRPGWHIEDTAITITHFGPRYDIHGGATELMFPHHEAEIAQAESYTGIKPFVNYWVHTGVLTVNREKMSKSLGNFYTIREILEKCDPETLRFLLINTHYRSPLEFDFQLLEEAKQSYAKLKNTFLLVKSMLKYKKYENRELTVEEKEFLEMSLNAQQKFIEYMDDDFNTREAIAVLFEFTRNVNYFIGKNAPNINKEVLESIASVYTDAGNILGLFERDEKKDDIESKLLDIIIEIREILRQKKEYELSDKIREKLKNLNIQIEDTKYGQTVKF